MTTHPRPPWPRNHPELLAIALDVALHPERRRLYSALVLLLADGASEEVRQKLTDLGLVHDAPGEVSKE